MLTPATRDGSPTLLEAHDTHGARGDARAIVYLRPGAAPEVVTGQGFRAAADRSAAGLRALGVREKDVVVIAHADGLDALYAFWGAMRLGAIPSMFPVLTEKLDPGVYMTSVKVLVAHAGARVVVTTDAFAPTLAASVGCPAVGFETLRSAVEEIPLVD